MKTAEAKISPASSHQSGKREPFFGHQQEGGIHSIASETTPFFSKPASVQAKLTVGQPNDKYELEADAVADKVVQKLSEPGTVQTASISPIIPAVQAKCAECEKEDKLQKKEEENTVEAVTDVQNETVALPDPPSCPTDGTGNSKSTSAAVQLKCSTCEAEESETKNAEETKKEELNHLPVQAKLTIGAPNDPFEKEADDVADHVVQKLGDNKIVQSKTDTVLYNGPQSIQAKSGSAIEEAVPAKEEEKKEEVPLEINKKSIDTGVPDPPPPNDEDNREKNNNTLQRKCNTCFAGNLTPDIHTKPIFESEEQPKVQRRCRECEEGDRIFLKTAGMLQLAGDLTSKGDGSRESIIAAAKSMLGKIEAKHDDGSGKRVGAEHLLEIFHLAAPGVWDDSTIQTAGAQMPSWCGIFSVWAHKKAGKDIGNWQMGKGVSAFGTLQQTMDPLPGDIGYIDKPYQHHCIVVTVDGDTVHSIDGNSGLYSEVIENTRSRSKYSGFFTAFSGGSTVQRKEESASTVHSSVENTLSSSKGSGTALPEPVQKSMETAMGADFSNVKIHTDSSAVQMSKDLNAQAFTHGSDIYFNTGKYNPDSTGGQHLLAHELTHTVQQGAAVQKKEVPSIQKSDDPDPIQQAIAKVYDALDGWTDSDDSYIIWNQFDSTTKGDTDKIVAGVASKADKSIDDTLEWMNSDMVTSDWDNLFAHFISVGAYRTDHLIANLVYSYLSGYTSDSNSHSILSIYAGSTTVSGALLGSSLTQLEGITGYGRNDAAEYLFGDMSDLDAHKLSQHFFNAEDIYAAGYAAYWIAAKVRNLLSGFTGMDDSEAIVKNFERTPAPLRSVVLFELEKICQEKWSQTAGEALMEDMWQSDYDKLRELMPDMLPPYSIKRTWYEWTWEVITDGFDFLTSLVEYGLCGLVGVIWGLITVVIDIIVAIVDIVIAVKDLLGLIVYYVSGGKFCKENYDRVSGFFKALGKLYDTPGEAISGMWNELTLEASLIEGPFAACERAIFWTSRVINLVVNIILIFAWGYGAVKTALKGIELVVDLARAGELIAALKSLPGKLWTAIKGLPTAASKAILSGASKIIGIIKNPVEIIAAARNTLTAIRLASEDEGFFKFLRKQAGKAIEGESKFWQERRDFWKKNAEVIDGDVAKTEGKLVEAVNTVPDDAAKAETIIKDAEVQANANKNKADDLMKDVNGTKAAEEPKKTDPVKPPPKTLPLNERIPEPWREGSPTRPPRLNQTIPEMQKLGYSDDTIAAIINNAYTHPDMQGSDFFSNLYNRVLKTPGSAELGGRANLDTLVNALAGEKDFLTARFLVGRVANGQSIAELMRVFTLEDIGMLRTQFIALSDAEFVRDFNGILPRVNGSREEVLALIKEAGDPALDNFNAALDRLGQGRYTPEEIRKSFAYGAGLADAMAKGGDALAKEIWENPTLEKDASGKYRVSASKTGDKAGDQAAAFIRARADKIVANTGVLNGAEINAQKWDMLVQSIRQTDLPTIVQNDIIGELWSSAKILQGRRMGYEVIVREVTLEILDAAGKPTGKKARLDAVFKKPGEMLYKEFKSSATATESANQAQAYQLLKDGKAGQLRPTGAKAETAFGGPGMPEFKAQPVDIERPPKM